MLMRSAFVYLEWSFKALLCRTWILSTSVQPPHSSSDFSIIKDLHRHGLTLILWSQQYKILMLFMVTKFMTIIINLLLTLRYKLSVKLPPAFSALQVYLPLTLSVTFVKTRVNVLFVSSNRRSPYSKMDVFCWGSSSLNMVSCGSGKLLIILQVRLALSPSCKGWLGPDNSILGRTTEKNKDKHTKGFMNFKRCSKPTTGFLAHKG